MSDSFADLWASTAPTKSTEQQQQQQQQQKKLGSTRQYDAFSILSASQPPSTARAVVANLKPPVVDRQVRQHHSGGRDADAFSALFASSLDGTAATTNMTMAERAAALANKAKATVPVHHTSPTPPGLSPASLWDGLDALTRPTTASPRPPPPTSTRSVPVTNLSRPTTTSPHSGASVEQDNDDWGLSEFASPNRSESPPAKTDSTSQPTNLWDLDEFASSEPRTSQSKPPSRLPPRSLTGTPGDFDFGDREDRFLGVVDSDEEDTFGIRSGHSVHPEDDILGDLGKPVSHSHSPSPNPPTSSRTPLRPQRTTASPPPHIIGQLVEMGFSPIDARAALANTIVDNDFDVQAAAELLLSQNSQEGSHQQSSRPPENERRNRERNGDRETRRPPPTRNDIHTESPNFSSTSVLSQSQIDTTAEKLLSQASEIGRGMFSKANALWKEGKERAVKMYEERAATANTAGGTPASDGRPRWMRDRDHADEEPRRPGPAGGHDPIRATVFKDDEVVEGETRQRPHAHRPHQSQVPSPEHEREVDLFSADSPTTAYQSPYRRGKPKLQAAPSPSIQPSSPALVSRPQAAGSTSIDPSTESQGPSRPPPPRALTTTIALLALTSSTSHKSAGTDAYKRGDFPVALAAYIRALSALPPEHVLRVPILTNVALVRTKVGELKEAVQACEQAIVIVGRFVGGADREGDGEVSFMELASGFDEKALVLEVGTGKVSVSVRGGGDATSNEDLPTCVDLIEGLSKAFRRRAEALEALEKWEMARSTWEVLLGAECAGSGVKGEAVKGVSRCRKMVDGGGGGGAGDAGASSRSAPSRTRPKMKHESLSTSTGFSPSRSAAVAALRSTNDAQQTEDAARLVCKDSVDARLSAWKSGREGNIRALLTSLDESVLWPELGWRKVGMAEVVSKGQVKGAYVRAIARVHPDKLNAGNTTVEQRMIANGVFGALNEAWTVFQQQ